MDQMAYKRCLSLGKMCILIWNDCVCWLRLLATITAEQILGSSGRIHKDTRIRLVLLRLLPDLPTLDDQTSEPVIKLS